MLLAQLQQKRNEQAARIQELAKRFNDAGKKWQGGEAEEWTRINAEYNATMAAMDEARSAEEVTRRASEVAEYQERSVNDRRPGFDDGRGGDRDNGRPTQEDRALAFQAWARHQMGLPLKNRHAEAARRCKINPRSRDYRVRTFDKRQLETARSLLARHRSPEIALRDMSAAIGQDGGYTIPAGFIAQLEVNMLHYGPMLQVADIMRTEDGRELPWPTADDTGNEGEFLGESASIGSSVDPDFGRVAFGAHKLSSKLVKVPTELLEDSAFDLASFLGQALGERIGRRANRALTSGTGVNQPRGFILDASSGKTAAATNAITQVELLDLAHSVDYSYRADASWMAHDNILLALRKLVDSDGRLLWQSSMSEGQPDRLHGYPVNPPNNAMDSSLAASNKTVAYGNFKKVKVRQVGEIRLRRLVERYADTDQEGFVAFVRLDGKVLDAGTDPIKYLTQAAA